jgi:hypothetical protein
MTDVLFFRTKNKNKKLNEKSYYHVPRRTPRPCTRYDRTQDRRHARPSHLQMGPRQGLRRRHDHREAHASRRVSRRRPSAYVPCLASWLARITADPDVFFWAADLTPEEMEAIDKAGAMGPPGPTLSLALRVLSCAHQARVRAAFGLLVMLFIVVFWHRVGLFAMMPCAH